MSFVNRSWCCEQLRLNFEARDRAGLYILATSTIHGIDGDPSFWICMRSVELDEFGKLNSPIKVILATQARITHCPWCGVELESFYRGRCSELLDELLSNVHFSSSNPQ